MLKKAMDCVFLEVFKKKLDRQSAWDVFRKKKKSYVWIGD